MVEEIIKAKRNGMNILRLLDGHNLREIVSNAYEGSAYFACQVTDEERIACENILGYAISPYRKQNH